MELSIIILNYKMRGLVKNCIKSILESEFDVPYEVIVVDNNSNDEIEKMLSEKYPQVRFIQTGANLGMGAGNNAGIKEAQGKHVLILNPDIFVVKDSLQKLYNYINEKPDVGLVAPRLLNPDKSLQYTCYRWHNFLTPIYRRTFLGKLFWAKKELSRFLMQDWDHATTRQVDWIQGSCLLVPKKVIDEVGVFDDRFFMYFEDTDLCRRIRKAGYKNVYLSDAEVIHLHRRQSADSGGVNALFNKLTRIHISSWMKYMLKWKGIKM
ncbi:glycosyltransferase family 2 protein [Candidatus Kuenenbacteria bacterium]|nr:glycosyltransferase family 2 protein [Candidatus Kuenenbacteria bacterium]